MTLSTRSIIIAAAAAAASVAAQGPGFIPLADKRFTYDNLPFQVDTDDGERGRQFGYNICNSTTEGPESRCQTGLINSLDDFCLWGPPDPNSLIGDTEGEAVAWCTKPGHGTRIIPAGALTGVQFMKTPAYVQVTGFIKQDLINIAANDDGGEMDPHGADQRGNPLGGLLFSNQFGTAGGQQFTQAVEWHNFMGAGVFCLKACDPAGKDAPRFCEHIFDRIGCERNAPASYEKMDGVFETCQGDNQDFPGVFTGSDGRVSTYTQPPESLGPISVIPYVARVPASSNCQQFQSAALYAGAPTVSAPAPTGSSSAPSSASGTSRNTSTNRPTSTGSSRSSGSASATNTPAAAVAAAIIPRGALAGIAAVVAGFLGAAFMV